MFNLSLQTLNQHLALTPKSLGKPRGQVIQVILNTKYTKFDIVDYLKQSKKTRRSEKLVRKEKAILQYSVVGKCLSFRRASINSTCILRNVVNLCPFESSYNVFSPLITDFVMRNHFYPQPYKKTSQYYLRKKSPSKSQITFSYVIGSSKNDIYQPELEV